jgi:hypothetical protein
MEQRLMGRINDNHAAVLAKLRDLDTAWTAPAPW